jgi:hypothetical protein
MGRLLPLTIAVDRAVPDKEFGGLLGISNLTHTVKEVPSDLKRAFYKDR